ncbi:hypothetical protein HG535_0C01680 [Zygotorulaspora mrakii]|uniref:amidase n=1 Tax=Zygotorulaspora mrakii TaxID=42260 RepID=A0A7H9B1H7_ZYGMR|nr:uncharacterized protein HG535_0C01680 [Zygotorulaspora mrakii]QLG71819.1 hypothetical protein HG535_0C01680 [Zygotorulaspora mrakii]
MSWKVNVEKKRAQLNAKIPSEWRIDGGKLELLKAEKKNLDLNLDKLCTEAENEITHSTILKLRDELIVKNLTCYEIAIAFCHRAALAHQVINCLSEIMFEEALKKAQKLDEQRPDFLPPLYGIPISLKDQCNVEGVDSTCGYLGRAFKPKKREEESLIVRHLREQGAILYVKTTVPSSMMATDTVSNTFGITLNGLNQNFSPGGSSGGEGALIAARGSLLGLGTDIGGSIRIPSSYHGLYGLKPTDSRLPYLRVDNSFQGRELIPSVIGPLARNLDDLRYFMDVMVNICKPWIDDVKCVPYHFDSKSKELHKNYVVGIWYGDGVITLPPGDVRALRMCEDLINSTLGMKAIRWEVPVEVNKELHEIAMDTDIADAGIEIRREFEASGEPIIDILKPVILEKGAEACSVNQWWALNKRTYEAKIAYREYYNSLEPTERPDVIISPLTLTPFRPGDMLATTLRYILFVNVLNFPSLAVPITKFNRNVDGQMDTSKAQTEEDRIVSNYWNELISSDSIQDFPLSLQIMSPTYDDNEVCTFGSWLMQNLQIS